MDRHLRLQHTPFGAFRIIFVFLIMVLLVLNSDAQFYNGSQMAFGKSRIQYDEFIWTYYKYDQYDIYFYLGGKELALHTAKFLEDNIKGLEDKLDTGLDDKMQFIIYNTLTDLKQSNIGLITDESYNTGGVTYIVGKKVFLYFDGNHENLDRQIRAGVAQTLVNQLLYGSSIGSQIKNTSLFPFPDWYINGLVSYVSEDWNSRIENHVKDGILSGRYDKFNQLTGEEATFAGHAFWQYIAETYGQSSITNIVYMAKVSRRLESGFLYILGISFKNLVNNAIDFYRNRYESAVALSDFPADHLQKKIKDKLVYSWLKLSPDGKYAAFTTNRSGKYRVYLKDVITGKRKKIMKDGYRLDEKIDYSYPLLAWHPSGRILAVMIEKKGNSHMKYYLLDEQKWEDVILYQFDKILDFAYSPDGRSLVMSAVQKGQTDIFVYDIGSNSFKQITKDPYDDLNPRIINSAGDIIFSSNRISDTLRLERKYKPKEVQKRYDLFLYQAGQKSTILRRVTKTPLANEVQPMLYEKGIISFLSDANGVSNRYIGWFDSTISFIDTTTHYRYFTNTFPITDYSRNILEQDVRPEIGKVAQVMYKDDQFYLQVFDQIPFNSLQRVNLNTSFYMDQLINLYGERTLKKEVRDSLAITGNRRNKPRKGFATVRQSQAINEILQADTTSGRKDFDINNYQFGQEGLIKKDSTNRAFTDLSVPLPGQRKKADEGPKRRNYNVEYFINQIVTQVDFSYLNQSYQVFTGGKSPIYLNPGFNALFQIGVTDLLEDYRIVGGVKVNLNLTNNEYLFSFSNLKHRLDKEIVFHRLVNEYNLDNLAFYRIFTHEFIYITKWPFSPVLALKNTLTYKYERGVLRSTDAFTLGFPKQNSNTGVIKEELIYDDTKNLGLNLFSGTRGKIFGEYYQSIDFGDQNLVVLGLDIRNYQRIHRMFIWANRLAASTSFGTNKLIYYMGGVDNWLFPKFSTNTPVDYSQNYAYQTLSTNMRGFQQNIRNGTSFAVINSELRFPVFRYFAKSPIKSDFLNNFQVVGFGDVGTAWTGPQPYSEENFLFTNIIKQDPLNITVKIQKDPIVGGFGFGARSRILGYFIRADFAWGVEDYQVQPSIFYLSLSLDF